MPNVLVSTPNYLLRYDTKERRTCIIEDNRREYYGISWFDGGHELVLSHSDVGNDSLDTFESYVLSETGYVSEGARRSGPILSLPHQIICVENTVLATNTGRNALSVFNRHDWSVRHYRYSQVMWDRYGNTACAGNHLNSVTIDEEYIYVLAHNFTKGSFVLKISRDGYGLVEILHSEATGMHNLWRQDASTMIACDTMRHGIIEFSSGILLWECDDVTRGLAATSDEVFVGVSEDGPRQDRATGRTGFWILDAGTFKEKEYHSLGQFGCVHEIRLIGVHDQCHGAGVMPLNAGIMGWPMQSYWADKKLAEAVDKRLARETLDIVIGSVTSSASGVVGSWDGGLGLALVPELSAWDVRVTATLDVSGPVTAHSSLIARYQGPDDQNMVAALFRRQSVLRSRIGLWRQTANGWSELCGRDVYETILNIDLLVVGSELKIVSDGILILAAIDPVQCREAGRVGMRLHRAGLSNFTAQAI